MKIKCPRCKSKLEVGAVGDLVSCPYCLLEFNVEEPKNSEVYLVHSYQFLLVKN